jgi:peroxiredoxin
MGWGAWLIGGLLALSVLGVAAFSLQLLAQQGRLLLRVERLEASLADAGISLSDALEGVPVGTVLSFELPDLEGQRHALADHAGRRVLLVNWSPDCSFCDMVAADLSEVEPALDEKGVDLVLLSRGEAQANRELVKHYGLAGSVLLADDDASLKAFSKVGTPAAYLVDEHGQVATSLVLGADKVAELAREVAGTGRRLPTQKPLSQSRLERSGLKPGTQAPPFTLPDLDGGEVSLEDHAGRRHLLVFSDPHCEPCMEVAPRLAELHGDARASGLMILMVSRGDPAENREKRDRLDLPFPIGLQRSWEISRAYGIFSTPVAFLIDEEGRIAHEVAIGPQPILDLVEEELAARKESPIEAA